MSRLQKRYKEEIVPALAQRLGRNNPMSLPRLEKIVVNMGIGKALENKARIEAAVRDMTILAGQRPTVNKARKSIAGFKLRQGDAIGCSVTLRRRRMYEFLDRLISVVLPRIRDFRGLSPKSFDGRGNYNLGLAEQIVFPEINIDSVEFVQGMDINIVIRSQNDSESFELLNLLGMPFRTN